jgi:hypothetical protein
MSMECDGGMIMTGETEEYCPIATLPTTNPTRADSGANPLLHGEKPGSNRLSHGTVIMNMLMNFRVA